MPAMLAREEYIEQAYFFRTFRERLKEDLPTQEILQALQDELLASTRLPMAVNHLRTELLHSGVIFTGMRQLGHYFTSFQAFVMEQAEQEGSRFDHWLALEILEREADYKSKESLASGLFVFQFESLARNRLGYDRGLDAIAGDPIYNEAWKIWIKRLRALLGTVDFADLLYHRSELAAKNREKQAAQKASIQQLSQPEESGTEAADVNSKTSRAPQGEEILFSEAAGRIAKANHGKDPLYLFAALQRQLGYPAVPRPQRALKLAQTHPELEMRLSRLEQRLQLMEAEQSGKLDLKEFLMKPPSFGDDLA